MTKTATHTPKYASIASCQSIHTNVKHTDALTPTPIASNVAPTKAIGGERAGSAAERQSAEIGSKSSQKQSPLTAVNVHAVAKKSKPSSPSTTSTEAGQSKESKDFEAGGSTSGSESADSQENPIKSCASTATARKDSAGPARTKNSFTPGPWRYECTNAGEIGSKDKVRVEAADGHIAIACRIMQNNGRDTFGKELNVHRNLQEVKANARLIAAAPDLLSLLDSIAGELQAWNSTGDPRPALWAESRIKRIRAAIAKATGQEAR